MTVTTWGSPAPRPRPRPARPRPARSAPARTRTAGAVRSRAGARRVRLPERAVLLLVSAVPAACLGAALAGTVVPGLFWLTVVSLGGLLVTGALGVATLLGRPGAAVPGEEQPVADRHGETTSLDARRRRPAADLAAAA